MTFDIRDISKRNFACGRDESSCRHNTALKSAIIGASCRLCIVTVGTARTHGKRDRLKTFIDS